MKYVVWSIIGRLIALIAILAFVFGIVYITQNTKFLWLLFLLFAVEFVPVYNITTKGNTNDVRKSK